MATAAETRLRSAGRQSTRQSAAERRESVLRAAVVEFASTGLHGTSTEAIAARAGISQPYLFRLFPSKRALFIEAVTRTFRRVREHFEAAAGELSGEEALAAMGASYRSLLVDRTFLLGQLQAYAACEDAEVRAAARRGFADLWLWVEQVTGAHEERLREFFAMGMLLNTVAALDLPSLDERWALGCTPGVGRSHAGEG